MVIWLLIDQLSYIPHFYLISLFHFTLKMSCSLCLVFQYPKFLNSWIKFLKVRFSQKISAHLIFIKDCRNIYWPCIKIKFYICIYKIPILHLGHYPVSISPIKEEKKVNNRTFELWYRVSKKEWKKVNTLFDTKIRSNSYFLHIN